MSQILQQYAALPVTGREGRFQVLLITSRSTGRWIIPKGHPEKKMTPSSVAALEALEEAGVSGTIEDVPLGRYQSTKRLPSGQVVPCDVTVFRLDVSQHHASWKEDTERKRLWVPLTQATRFVDDGGLGDFLEELSVLASTQHALMVQSS
ncbi:NUDIX hydrolase [Acidisoma cladoniae]|jgi:8-oxo-dGTP pyrophosphatase MutT (NUDIX family)|uniref:NUDIX hydrolase n=1 Tax=Acidisoma cladoniae TaxID=3040935 RepID=UPI0025502EB5|nr:NUDIX hydrolase [Acidisoma sp. PAMC 29798]